MIPATPAARGTQVPVLQAPALAALPGVRHAFFTRAGGVSGGIYATLNAGVGSNDAPENVAANRARMAETLGVAAQQLVTCYQMHSAAVVVADAPWEARPRADAIVTGVAGLAIGVSTADCAPVLFADPAARVIGAAHAGWRGALAGVTDQTIAAMERLGAAREGIVVALGPMIRRANYETGGDLMDQFLAADPANERFFRPAARDGHFMFNLAGYLAARLAAAGIEQIADIGDCTYADADRFFSYRRMTHRNEADYGRHVNAIVLE
jgi:YfiH family protein